MNLGSLYLCILAKPTGPRGRKTPQLSNNEQ